jgi:hypothetical protein
LSTSVTSGTLVLGDVGKPLIISAGGYNMTGATVTLLISIGPIGSPSVALTPCVVSGDGLSVTYTTTGPTGGSPDFTASGNWNLQLEVSNPPALPWLSPPGSIFVYPHL